MSDPNLLIATRNQTRVMLHRRGIEDAGFNVQSLLDLTHLHDDRPSEDDPSAIANALMKARHYHSSEHPWVFAVDAGLRIDALGGEPGIMTRRWAGKFPDSISDADWLEYVMGRLEGVPLEKRTAHMFGGWALIDPDGNAHTHEVEFHFSIAEQPVRKIYPGAPLMAVYITDDGSEPMQHRIEEVYKAWQGWGVLPKLRNEFAKQCGYAPRLYPSSTVFVKEHQRELRALFALCGDDVATRIPFYSDKTELDHLWMTQDCTWDQFKQRAERQVGRALPKFDPGMTLKAAIKYLDEVSPGWGGNNNAQ